MTLYRLDIKYTKEYGDVDEQGNPEITVTRDPDHPGVYIYTWVTHYATLPADEINGTLTEIWNGISTYEFVVYQNSDLFDDFFAARTSVRLWSEKEQEFVFSGRVINVIENMDEDGKLYKTVQCENELSYLCDSICDLTEVQERMERYDRVLSVRDVLITMLELHHIKVEGFAGGIKKGFMPPDSTWDEQERKYDYSAVCYPPTLIEEALSGDADTTWALIQDILIDKMGMDIWVTYDDSVVPEGEDPTWTFGYNVLNLWYGTATHGTGDPITLSTNMKSLKIETAPTSNGRITRIVPLGGIGVNGKRLNVETIPQYHEGWTDPSYEKEVANEILSLSYGHVDKVTLHEDLVDNGNKTEAEVQAMIQELYRRGRAEADALTGGITSITVNAVDLYEAGYSQNHKFKIGYDHRIINEFFGLDASFRLIKKVTNLAEPWSPQLEFAKIQTSSTHMSAQRHTNTSNRIYNVENMISTRLDKTAVMRTTQDGYDGMTSRNANTVHYADQGDGTWRAYMGDEPIVFSEGGGGTWTVDTAAVYDADNLHQWVADEELMADINAQTKLYYGGAGRIIPIQGYACRFGGSTALYLADHTYFGSEISVKVKWRERSSGFVDRYIDIRMTVNSVTRLSVENDEWRYTMAIIVKLPNGTVETYTTSAIDRASNIFLIPTVTSVSGNSSFSSNYGSTETVDTPNGYAVCSSITLLVGAITADNPDNITTYSLRTPQGGTTVWICGRYAGREYICVPLEDKAEMYYDIGVTKRSEPREDDGNA